MVQDTISFRNSIKSNAILRNDIRDALVILYQEINKKEQVQKIATVWDYAADQVFSPNQNTYNGMISSGALKLIKNLELREAIINLYSDYDEKRALFIGNNDWMINIVSNLDIQTDLTKFSPDHLDIYTTEEMLSHDDWAFLNNKSDEKFKLTVRAFSSAAWNQKISDSYYTELINSTEIVLQLIEKELK